MGSIGLLDAPGWKEELTSPAASRSIVSMLVVKLVLALALAEVEGAVVKFKMPMRRTKSAMPTKAYWPP